MYINYNNKKIKCISTELDTFLRYKRCKIDYGVIIPNTNRFSTILSSQNIDIIILNNKQEIVAFKYNMFPNTIFEDKDGDIVVVLPPGTFNDLKIGNKLIIEDT